LFREEELYSDLKPYLQRLRCFDALRHPLVFMVPYSPQMNHMANEQYNYKTKAVEEALEKKDWSRYIWMHEKPHRIEAFIKIHHQLNDRDYWKYLGEVWVNVENIWQYPFIERLLRKNRPGKEYLMAEEERQFLEQLPDEFVIFRGHQRRNRYGWSWTLSYSQAWFFANRFSKNGGVISSICKKSDVLALFLGRGESEIVIDPKKLTIKTERKTRRPLWLQKIWAQLAPLGISRDHGVRHWDKVDRNVLKLVNEVPEADVMVCRLFAVLHDCQRKNENDDLDHGLRAAKFAKKINLPISQEQLSILSAALIGHNKDKISTNPTIGVCWDADRLDLVRVGVVPKAEYLSTEAAQRNIGLW
jgi:hypothetical protein